MRGQMPVCLDCHARQQQLIDEERQYLIASEGPFGRSGVHTYRHSYYANRNYSPFYSGLYYSQYYDTYDARAFDKRASQEGFDDDTMSMGFLDS